MYFKRFTLILFFLTICLSAFSQQRAELYGRVFDSKGNPMELVNVAIIGSPGGAVTDIKGSYSINVSVKDTLILAVSSVGYETKYDTLTLKAGEKYKRDFTLKASATMLETAIVEDRAARTTTMTRLSTKETKYIPTLTESVTQLILSQPGVSTSNEMSSQYRVRGGNYDENLVYVNDIEIYRPMLIRSGEQEGLPFINSDLVGGILFSAGGFAARYGDKMASVLDIQYKRPSKRFGGSVEGSFLGAKAHLEGKTKNEKFYYLIGGRYKTNTHFLKGLQTKGNYQSDFGDVQANLNWDISKKWTVSLLGYGSWNSYSLTPKTRETKFGTLQQSYLLKIYFEGKEVTKYNNYLGAVTATYRPNKNTRLRFIGTAYQSIESENYDIFGEYWIGLVDNNMGSETFGEALQSKGIGSYLDHARNALNSIVANFEHIGSHKVGKSFLEWGAKFQYEDVLDVTNEWEMVDSAGFTLPTTPDSVGYVFPTLQGDNPLLLQNVIKSDYHLTSHRVSGFLQNTWDWEDKGFTFTLGGRFHYWNTNHQMVFSPRANVSFKPDWKKDVLFRFSTGYYFQPPTYKELKNLQGELNKNVKAQKSLHFVLGYDWNFKIRKRPFKFVTELYYKYLNELNPYVIDNVSIRYLGKNIAHGFSYGVDFKVNGEFVSGTESWMTLSLMRNMEDIEDDFYYTYKYYNEDGAEVSFGSADVVRIDSTKVEPKFIPRPSDQRIHFSLFFQDYIPGAPTWKVFVNLVFGTGLPSSPPNANRAQYHFRMTGYKRVDVGFSKQLISEAAVFSPKNPLRWLNSAWVSLEVFNLFNFSNEISYTWVKDVNNMVYAVPNYLTPMQINLRLSVSF